MKYKFLDIIEKVVFAVNEYAFEGPPDFPAIGIGSSSIKESIQERSKLQFIIIQSRDRLCHRDLQHKGNVQSICEAKLSVVK